MGSGGRSRPERQGTQSGAGTGRAVLEGSGSDAALHAYPLHSTIKGAHCARSWIWAVARRSIVGCPNEIKGQKWSCVILRGSRTNVRCLAISGRSSVTVKKNAAPQPSHRCSTHARRPASDAAGKGGGPL